VNNVVGLSALLALALGSGALVRGVRRLRAGARPEWWHWVGGLAGALLVAVSAAAAPRMGVALLTVALVCGQTGGSLAVDQAGLSPAGRQPATPARVIGVALAVAAVGIGALGKRGDLEVGLLALAVLAGCAVAVQQAANGHLARLAGEPLVAATINFVIGGTVLLLLVAAVAGDGPPDGWDAPFGDWLGGLLGASVVVTLAWVVHTLGVLRTTLALVAGQSAGALALDLIAPAPGEAVTAGTVIGVALTLVAVAITMRRPSRHGRTPG
jgi:transporter family-2 protein